MLRGASARAGWGWVAGVTAFIYASLPVMPSLWGALDRRAPLMLRGSMVLVALLSVGGVWAAVLYERAERRPLPLMVLALATALLALGLYLPAFPTERFHFIEYGLLGALILRASLRSRPGDWKVGFGLAALVLVALGVMDEVFQYLLPNRVFEWRDIWFNIAGGLIGFGAYLVMAPPESSQ